jgi:hypothetical protein
MILEKQWKTCIHYNSTVAPIAYFTECLPPGICADSVNFTTLVKHMFPVRASDLFLADRAGTRCLFHIRNITQIKKLQKEVY